MGTIALSKPALLMGSLPSLFLFDIRHETEVRHGIRTPGTISILRRLILLNPARQFLNKRLVSFDIWTSITDRKIIHTLIKQEMGVSNERS